MSNLIYTHEKIALVVSSLEHDLSGAFIPAQRKKENKPGNKAVPEDRTQAKTIDAYFL